MLLELRSKEKVLLEAWGGRRTALTDSKGYGLPCYGGPRSFSLGLEKEDSKHYIFPLPPKNWKESRIMLL